MFDDNSRSIVMDHINLFKSNKTPLNNNGDPAKMLFYKIDLYSILDNFFDALIINCTYTGSIQVESNCFDDNIGYKIAKIIEKNFVTTLIIENRSNPFSDRVAKIIGDALEHNTSLVTLEIFLNIDKFSPIHLCKFLKNPKSKLENLYSLRLNKVLFEYLTNYLSNESKLKNIGFYYEPLKFIDLFYEPEIDKETYHKFANKIQNDSNITSVEVIPIFQDFDEEINKKSNEYINDLTETLLFSCKINRSQLYTGDSIETIYDEENQKMKSIM